MGKCIDADKLMETIKAHHYPLVVKGLNSTDYGMFTLGIQQVVDEQPTVDAEPVAWIPITARPIDEEERLKWAEEVGLVLENDEAWIYTSQLPDDEQEVLVCGRNGRVWIDTFYNDPDYECYFEDNGEMDGIVAWMPLPKPYRERREDE